MLRSGDRFGDYAVVRLLGKGGMGSVFLLETAEGGQVAAKILDPDTGRADDAPRGVCVSRGARFAHVRDAICTPDERPYERLTIPLAKWRGKQVKIEVEHSANGWFCEHAFWSRLEVIDGTGRETLGSVGVVRTDVFPAANPKSMRWKKRGFWTYVTKKER